MNQVVDLSPKAKKICNDNYNKNCGGCPIRSVCVGRIGPGYEGLNSWVQRVNEYAESIAR